MAAAAALTADGPLEYLEQPCATVDELAELRRRIDVPIAADESIRKADDPFAVVRAGAADIAVLKVAPLVLLGPRPLPSLRWVPRLSPTSRYGRSGRDSGRGS